MVATSLEARRPPSLKLPSSPEKEPGSPTKTLKRSKSDSPRLSPQFPTLDQFEKLNLGKSSKDKPLTADSGDQLVLTQGGSTRQSPKTPKEKVLEALEKQPLSALSIDKEHAQTKVADIAVLTKAEHNACELQIKDGLLYDSTDSLADTRLRQPIYIITTSGKLYVNEYGDKHNGKDLLHPSLAADEEVAAAGRILIQKGRINKINNSSGHFKPSSESHLNAVQDFVTLHNLKNRILVGFEDSETKGVTLNPPKKFNRSLSSLN